MMVRFIFFCLILMSVGLVSCDRASSSTSDIEREIFFFDLQTFFDQEIARLEAATQSVEKKLEINGQTETLQAESVNFEKELSVFRQSDINKVSWLDKYQGDTTLLNGQLSSIIYQALDEQLKTRRIEVAFENGAPQQIQIENRVASPILKSTQLLSYHTQDGYGIDQEQKIRFLAPKSLKVQVKYQ